MALGILIIVVGLIPLYFATRSDMVRGENWVFDPLSLAALMRRLSPGAARAVLIVFGLLLIALGVLGLVAAGR